MNDILKRIETLRESREIAMNKLAKSAGIPQSTYAAWVKNDRLPDMDSLQKIADFFDVSVGCLITGSDFSDEPLTFDVGDELRFILSALFKSDLVYWGGTLLSEREICALSNLLRKFVDFVDVMYEDGEQL